MAKGKFITLEGGEGTGKSTQVKLLAARLGEKGHVTVVTREPGGSDKAEAIRDVLLSGRAQKYGPEAEAMLFAVAREDHLESKIRPALARGEWVISDRFSDSTRAYQGACGAKEAVIDALERIIVGETQPDLTLILDLPAEEGLKRMQTRSGSNGQAARLDAFEAKDIGYHEALRKAFLEIASRAPERCVVIDAGKDADAVAAQIWKAVRKRLKP